MNNENKSLLLQDLSARLPYGVKIHKALYGATTLNEKDIESFRKGFDDILIPYLRPMSSMTEEEKKEYGKVCELDTEILTNYPMNGEPFPALYNSQDWLNVHHFDYRGLIPMGLALEAPKGMYEKDEIE